MTDFISVIKRVETYKIIYALSVESIKMFAGKQHIRSIAHYESTPFGTRKVSSSLLAWDIANIEYLSVVNSNDYRHSDNDIPLGQLVKLYRIYENKHSVAPEFKDTDIDGIFRLILGMTSEQFNYQSYSWILERFNRNYFILLAAKDFEHRSLINTDAIIKRVFGFSANNYISILLMVYWLCTQHPDPLSAPEELYHKKGSSILTKENLKKIIEYYSCTYEELRNSPLKHQLLYSKPFIQTKKYNDFLSSNVILVNMLLANGLYWVVRDYYRSIDSQEFTNAFGLLFEDYIKHLANSYCSTNEWNELAKSNNKGADFVFDFGELIMIIEAKSSLLQLNGKQQVPNISSINNFMEKTIKEAYSQLQRSYSILAATSEKPIIKVILLYDEFSNTAILQQAVSEIFDNDRHCFIMTIREFEILLYHHKNNKPKQDQIISCILAHLSPTATMTSILAIYNDLSIFDNPHISEQMNFFKYMLDCLQEQLK